MHVFDKMIKRILMLCAIIGFSVPLSGCGGMDGVDITLPGVGNIMAKTKRAETNLVDRGKLILPPRTALGALPTPGSGAKSVNNAAWPIDPDLKAKRVAALKAAKKKQEIEKGNFKTYDGQEGFDRATDSFNRREGVINKYYNKGK